MNENNRHENDSCSTLAKADRLKSYRLNNQYFDNLIKIEHKPFKNSK